MVCKKYIIYCRKSSEDEDRQVLSIDSQIKELKDIALKMNFTVVEVLTESMSAKATGRPIFNLMMKKIKSGEANAILCWKLDRLARNMKDGGDIIDMLQRGVIKHIQGSDRDYNTDDNVLFMSVEFGMANQFVRDLSKNTKRGLKAKFDKGWMSGVAPLGYMNDKYCDKGVKEIKVDNKRFPIVRKMWDLMLTGNCPVRHIWETAVNEWGLRTPKRKKSGDRPIALSALYKIFTNPFYFGEIHCQGEFKIGKHKPMITQEEYNRVQFLLGTKGKSRPKKHNFSIRGVIRYGECGALVTAERKTKKIKTTREVRSYIYYHCTKRKNPKCTQKSIIENKLEKQIVEHLKSIEIPEEYKNWAIKWLNKISDDEVKGRTDIYKNQQNTFNSIQREIDALLSMRLRGLIDDEEYSIKKNKLIRQKDLLSEKMRDTENRAEKWLELSEKTFNFACYASLWFKKGDLRARKKILSTLGSNQTLKDGILTINLEKPLKYFKENSQIIKQDSCMLELENIGLDKEKTGTLMPDFSRLLAYLDSFRTFLTI